MSMQCNECSIVFDGFVNKLFRKSKCKSCYVLLHEKKADKVESDTCIICNTKFQETGKFKKRNRGHCIRCYSAAVRIYTKSNKCKQCLGPNSMLSSDYCKLCRKAASGKFKLQDNIIQNGSITLPPNLKKEIALLLVRYKWKLNEVTDDFRVVNAYLSVFQHDMDLDATIENRQTTYMIRVLKNLYDFIR